MSSVRPGVRAARSIERRLATPKGRVLAIVLAAGTLFALGLRFPIGQGLTVGTVLMLALLPCWWPAVRRYRGARVFLASGLVAIISGVWLTGLADEDHSTSMGSLVSALFLLIGLLGGVGVILWARQLMSDSWVGIWFGLGMLAAVFVSPDAEVFASNPWKFGFSTPLTIIALAIAIRVGKRWLELVLLLLLVALSAITDARSSSAIFVLAVILIVVQFRPTKESRRASAVRFVVATGAISLIVFNIAQSLILDGYLGDAARERTVEQIDTSGSLLLGGRPELAATIALMADRPFGFGAGTLPTFEDITVAKTGMASIGYQPNNGYVESYMFGGRYELHSNIGDLWVNYGLPGLVFAAVIAVLAVRGLSTRLAANAASALVIYLAVRGFWNLLFSPLYGSQLLLMLLIGLVLFKTAEAQSSPTAFARGALPSSSRA